MSEHMDAYRNSSEFVPVLCATLLDKHRWEIIHSLLGLMLRTSSGLARFVV
jgi:hypothetical protein